MRGKNKVLTMLILVSLVYLPFFSAQASQDEDINASNQAPEDNDGPLAGNQILPKLPSISREIEKDELVEMLPVSEGVVLSINGSKFNDANADGIWGEGEVGLSDWTIHLFRDGKLIQSTITDSIGNYQFKDLAPGKYSIEEEKQDGWIQTAPGGSSYNVTLVDKDAFNMNFGNHLGPLSEIEKKYALMSEEATTKEAEEGAKLSKAYISPEIERDFGERDTASFSLLNYLTYTPAEQNQNPNCGNCWVWASTGASGIDLAVQKGIYNRLSVQYLTSKYNGGSGSGYACCGAGAAAFASFYSTEKLMIPWSNANAHFQDAGQLCGGTTKVPWTSISTNPNYALNSIEATTIPTIGVGQTVAINNIKNVLLQKKAVYFSLAYPSSTYWGNFQNWWDTQPETAIWNPDIACGQSKTTGANGHGILIVGWDEATDPSNPCWLVVNSWGAPTNRPNGLFRVKMNMNYDCSYPGWRNAYGFYTFNINWANPTPPGKATLTSPTGSISETQPTYKWNPVSGSTYYYLWIDGPSGNVFKKWYTAAEVTSGSICQIKPEVTLTTGNSYTWWIQTWNPAGYGPWSNPMSFSVGVSPPSKATLISPTGSISETQPTYKWNPVSGSTYYYLWIDGPSGNVFNKWYTAAEVTSGSICQIKPEVTLTTGNSYTWWIQTWNPAGYGPWSNSMSFSVGISPPGKATLISPTGSISETQPTYKWNPVSGSTWYYLWIDGPSGNVFKKWYTAAEVTSGSICQIKPAVTLATGNSYTWWIQTWNPAGYGPWSNSMSLSVGTPGGFSEHFDDSPENWYAANGYAWYIGSSILFSTFQGIDRPSAFYLADFSDFVYEAKIKRDAGSDDGNANAIIVRGKTGVLCPTETNKWDTAYYFQYNRQGSFSIFKMQGCTFESIQPWTTTSAINQGDAWNILKVNLAGNQMSYYINGQLVWSGTDSSISAGMVGVDYYAEAGAQFSVDYATLTTGASTVTDEISPEQRVLNEESKDKNILVDPNGV